MCVPPRERERESVCVCVRERVCVCVCERETEADREILDYSSVCVRQTEILDSCSLWCVRERELDFLSLNPELSMLVGPHRVLEPILGCPL